MMSVANLRLMSLQEHEFNQGHAQASTFLFTLRAHVDMIEWNHEILDLSYNDVADSQVS
jgi:hypothetical protein